MEKVVFVLGAGASHEINMPLGWELAKEIASRLELEFEKSKALKDGARIYEAAEKMRSLIPSPSAAAKIIHKGGILAASIDDFLASYPAGSVRDIGKATIVSRILAAERGSNFFFNHSERESINYAEHHNNWFVQLMREAGPRVKEAAKLFDGVAFVVFNYDRCLEHFLYYAIKDRYNLDETDTRKIIRDIKIIHPYGSIASLRQYTSDQMPYIEYGEKNYSAYDLINNISTYTEEQKDKSLQTEIHELFKQANHIVFLGFAFHQQNMKLLQPSEKLTAKIYATAFKASEVRCNNIKSQLSEFSSGGSFLHVPDMSAKTMLSEYGSTIFQR